MACPRTPCCFFFFFTKSSLLIALLLALHYYQIIPVLKNRHQPISDLVSPSNSPQEPRNLLQAEEEEAAAYNGRSTTPCDIFDGRWVMDDGGPAYDPGTCPFVDDAFDCFKNGRPDTDYAKWRWQPNECDLPRIEGGKMLEMMRGKRLAFVGDSLNRNMWESLACTLRHSLPDKTRADGVRRTNGSYAVAFTNFNCSIEFFPTGFLVQDLKVPGPDGADKDILRLDLIKNSSLEYADADVMVFNTGHWWTHEKTSQGEDYYQEGGHVYSRLSNEEALGKAMRTWARWVDGAAHFNRTRVFFRGFSSSHFGGGGWNQGGACDGETLPADDDARLRNAASRLVGVVETVVGEMRSPVAYLNVTRMTSYRKDGHPSRYRPARADSAYQDCSHWCLPGVPDAWNEMLYAMLLRAYDEPLQHHAPNLLIHSVVQA